MPAYYVMVNSGRSTFTKEAQFFIDQGGLRESWGKHWTRIEADSLEDAQIKGCKLLGGNPTHCKGFEYSDE